MPPLKKLLLTLFSVLTLNTWAQLNLDNLQQFSEKNGLSSETVNRVLVDKKGYIWIGTPNGLSRYDGYEFKQFFSNPTDSTAIQGMLIYAMMEDEQGNIWAGTNPSFLEMYDPKKNTFKSYDYSSIIDPLFGKNPLYGYTLFSVRENANHRIYFIVTSYEEESWLLYLDPKDNVIKIYNGPDEKAFRGAYRLIKGSSGEIWVLSNSGMFFIDKNNQLKPYHTLDNLMYKKGKYPTDMAFTSDQHMLVITDDFSLIDLNLDTDQTQTWEADYLKKQGVSGTSFNHIVLDQSENIWIGTGMGLYYFDRKNHDFEAFTEGQNKDFEHIPITSLAIDHFGNLWIGTANKGLLYYEEKPNFISYRSNNNEENSLGGWVGQIFEASDRKIWLRNNNGINILDIPQKKMQLLQSKSLPPYFNIATIWENDRSVFMSMFEQSVYRFSLQDQSISKAEFPGFPEKLTIRSFHKDVFGNEWYGTDRGLYCKKNNTQSYKNYDLLHLPGADMRSNNINSIFESVKYGLWLLTDNGFYLYRYDNDSIERHGFDPKLGDTFITQDMSSFYEDPNGNIWLGLWQGGLANFNPETKTIKNYTADDGLPSMSIQGILGDEKNGTLWLSSFNGLTRFDPSVEKFNNFSVMDGIQGSQFSDGACLQTSDGLLIFGGSNGITILDPDEIKTNYAAPKVFLTDLKLFNRSVIPGENSVLKKPIDETDEVILNHNQNDLSLEFVALHFSNPLKNEYAYTLENYDDTWRNVGSQNQAFYPNLSPGKYLFKVKAANDKGVWSDESSSLQITIKPPWWKTWWAYSLYALGFLLMGILLHRFFKARTIRIEREKSKDRELKQAKEIEKAYTQLKTTQTQLIQSEKMASLGELTAGIAHEIQNPLNFVNNFAEVSTELIEEVEEEIKKKPEERDEGLVTHNMVDLKENLKKINHHGKRAGEIVKGMLQHSRAGSGQKEWTDLNTLADEYFRLAYHGLRAKDKSFNAQMESNFDADLPKMEVVPQEFGRVLLNLMTNAFYAVNERNKKEEATYKPTVTVSTKKEGSKILISVKDNGVGIPDHIKEKIFQPFFTTKPTGSGTGLGLSLSYDIVKAHGGEIKLKSTQDLGTEFIIELPLNKA
ncbi:sensor histidine kinase [Namhaeicola litoreus]|uniref:histidine kinase n=1 Tax=Namhaeicola litoreus TaxID=1052145 RepID=A0ABW3XZK0_9FLAO